MTAVKSMDMESIPYDLNFLAGEPQNSSSVRGDQMDCGTLSDLSDVFLPDETYKGSDLFLFNPSLNTTTTNRDGISGVNPPLLESFAYQDSGFSFDRKLYSSPSYTDDDLYSIEKYLSEDQVFPNLLNCGNLSPLSSEDVDSILDTTSLSDDGDISLSPVGSPPSSPEFQAALSCEEIPLVPISSSPSLFHHLIHTNDSDGVQTSDSILAVSSLGHATIDGETSRSSSPCSLVSSPGKEKRTKSYRTKKTPYSWDKGTESIPSPINNDGLEQPQQQLSKKEKKKLQNKNAATRYRQKMKEEAEVRKYEEEGLLKENRRLKNRVEEIQKEIQYLKNLQKEINKVRTKS